MPKVKSTMMLLLAAATLLAAHTEPPQMPPRRAVPADVIQLDNGSTTFVSSLEDYLARTEPSSSGAQESTRLANLSSKSARPVWAQLEREEISQVENMTQEQINSTPPSKPKQQSNSSGVVKPIPQHWQVKSLLNVTHDYPLAYSQIICGYVWPLMAAITLFTNLMIVFVLTQRDMLTPTNVVLTAIAIADIIPIVVPVPWFIYLFAMNNDRQVLYPPLACYFYQHSTRSVSEVFYFLSTWLNLLLAIQDYLTACRPKVAKKYCQLRVVVIEIVALTVLAFLLNLPQALKLVFKSVKFYYNGQLTEGCKMVQARWFKDFVGDHVALYDDVFTAIIVLFVDGGPALGLITLTCLLIRQLHKQRIRGYLLMEQARTASKRRRERRRQQEHEASARVMIFVLIAFLAVKIPFATTYTLMIIQSRFKIKFVDNLLDFQTAISITDLVFVLSYPINFTIFCCCSKKFRHKCVQLLAECDQNQNSAKNRFMKSFSTSLDSQQSCRHDSLATQVSRQSLAQRANEVNFSGLINISQHRPLVDVGKSEYANFQPLHSQCQDCCRQANNLQRLSCCESNDSNSWPPVYPPPLAALRDSHYRLPQIITTRCESINESPDLAQDLEEASNSSGSSSSASSELDEVQVERRPPIRPHRDDTNQTTQSELDTGGYTSDNLSFDAACKSHSEEASHRPSRVEQAEQLHQHRQHHLSRPSRVSRPSLGQMGDKQRSLSLSNSNLSTLSSATVMLAEALMTVVGADIQQSQPAESTSKSTGHLSWPLSWPGKKSAGGGRKRRKDKDRK